MQSLLSPLVDILREQVPILNSEIISPTVVWTKNVECPAMLGLLRSVVPGTSHPPDVFSTTSAVRDESLAYQSHHFSDR